MLALDDDAVLPDRPDHEVPPAADVAPPHVACRSLLPAGVGFDLRERRQRHQERQGRENDPLHASQYTR